MKKAFIILAICGLFAIITSDPAGHPEPFAYCHSEGAPPLRGEPRPEGGERPKNLAQSDTSVSDWKDYPLSLVDNTIDRNPYAFVKVLTPLLIQNNPTPTVYTETIQTIQSSLPGKFAVYAKGKVEGVDLILIDEDKNGKYNEMGTDVMVIGNSPYGIPLGRIINIKNKLYECKVAPKGEKVSLKPYEGKYGVLDLTGNFKCPSKLNLAIVNPLVGVNKTTPYSDDIYIDVANDKNILLPCGTYQLWLGYIAEGTSHVAIRQNEMGSIEIREEFEKEGQRKPTAIKWGAPFRIDFQFTVKGNEVTVPCASLKVFGSANEEYFNFFPSLLPQVEVIDSKGHLVAKGAFKGIATMGGAILPITDYSAEVKRGATPPYKVILSLTHKLLGELKGEKQQE